MALPLLATQILWINLITDSAHGLTDRVIDGRIWAGVIEIGAVMAVVTLLTIDLYLPNGLIEGSRNLYNARTAAFTTLVFAQLFNCFNARSENTSAFPHLFTNPWLWGAVALSVLLQVAVVNLGFLNVAFGTVPLELDQWLMCAGIASAARSRSPTAVRFRRPSRPRTHLRPQAHGGPP